MPRGGARGRSGPPPNPHSLRQDPGEWIHLPASGRQGEPPAWPLTRQTKREAILWACEWARPQAVMWEQLGLVTEVALYVRTLRRAEASVASAALLTLVKQQMEFLGVSIPGLARNHWIIDGDHAAQEPGLRATGTEAPAPKSRWKVLDGGG